LFLVKMPLNDRGRLSLEWRRKDRFGRSGPTILGGMILIPIIDFKDTGISVSNRVAMSYYLVIIK